MLTKTRALLNCIKMWEKLAETGSSSKFSAVQKTSPGKLPRSYCWACEFTAQKHGYITCRSCPISEWASDKEIATCTLMSSPFLKWNHAATASERSLYAHQVAKLARKNLKRLRAEKE